jgi:hypothetical protein
MIRQNTKPFPNNRILTTAPQTHFAQTQLHYRPQSQQRMKTPDAAEADWIAWGGDKGVNVWVVGVFWL